MDYQDIQQRKLTKSTEMFWAPSPSMPNQGGVLGFLPYWCVRLQHRCDTCAPVLPARSAARAPVCAHTSPTSTRATGFALCACAIYMYVSMYVCIYI